MMTPNLHEYDLLVASDLHLSEGRDANTKKISLNEDFFFDEEFARFLDFHMHRMPGRPAGRKWHLIINGDFADFLQVVSTDVDREFCDYLGVTNEVAAIALLNFDRDHRDYGFGCGPKETVFKLWKIMMGHWVLFEALAGFVAEGNVLTIGRGNHDVEFFYEEVQQAFVPKLRGMWEESLVRSKDPNKDSKLLQFDQACREGRVRFMDWFYYEPGLIWVEHGNQYDKPNSFRYWLCPLLPALQRSDDKRKDEIDLPWGSFFVRYLFNQVEMKEPFADNIKPQTKFIGWFLSRHPVTALRFLFGDGRYMLAKMARAFKPVPESAYAARKAHHLQRLKELANESGISEGQLLYFDFRRAPSILREPLGWWKLVRFFTWIWPGSLALLALLLALLAVGFTFTMAHVVTPLIPVPVQWILWNRWITHETWFTGVLVGLRWPLSVLVAVALGSFVCWLFADEKKPQLSYLAEHAKVIQARLGVRYVSMGHTHDTDLQSIGSQGQEYFNTGTWTKVFSEEERLIREESELVFLQAVRREKGMKVNLMKWADGPGEPRLVKLFSLD